MIPKQIPSRVYASRSELLAECAGLDPETTKLLVSEPVEIVAEVRCFVLEGRILDLAFYEGRGDLNDARRFGAEVVGASALPRAVVLDIGLLADGRWILVELNAAWGAGLNGCDAARVVPAIAAATRAA